MNQFEKESLGAHNKYRASHHAIPLTWNTSLAREAQAWAEYLAHEDRLKHANTDDGENIYMSFGDVKVTGNVAVDKWYQEVKEYSFNRPGFQSNTGHFTQIVWRGSKEIGVGKAQGYDGKVFVVARYRPPGNNLRTFEENVLPTQKHMRIHNSAGWDHPTLNGDASNYDYSDHNSQQWKNPDRWDPVLSRNSNSPKSVLDPARMTPEQWQSRQKGAQKKSNKDGTGHNKFIDHKWDSGKWFDEDIIEPSLNSAQHSSPERKIFQDKSNVKGAQKYTSPAITARWQPEVKETKDPKENAHPWKGGQKGYYRDSVDRNKSANKVRLSTEKWESINNENEVDGRGDIKVGRNRTRESIKRWEEKTFNQPNLPFQHPRPAAQTKPIKPSQSQQSYSERWDPLWGDRPLNDSQPRPVSWDMRLFNEDREDNYRSFIEPRERKITTTIDEGPRKTVVSSVTIILKGNERCGPGNKTRSKSTEDLRYTRSTSRTRKESQPVNEAVTEQNVIQTKSRPKSEEFNWRNGESSRRLAREAQIVPEVKKRNNAYDTTDSQRGKRDIQKRNTFPMLDHFSQQGLQCHNIYRALHGASNLMWSPEMASAAQAWAEKLARERTLKHSSRERGADGENLAMFPGDYENAAKKAVDMWYEEISNYDFSRPGYQPRSGHFTQLVWKESKEFGMGCAQTSDGELHIVVARYRPPGNVIRNYELNVFPKHYLF